MELSGAQIIVRTLIEQGCDVVFGYPGGQVVDLYDALYEYRDELRHVLVAHEQGAAHAADGYARATGRVGVAIATSGPGATNLVTGIATAYMDSVPMVAITGNVSTDVIGTDGFQEIDITGITLPITKHNYVVGSVGELADTIRGAFSLAMSGRRGPVLVDVPKDIQEARCEYEPQPPVGPAPAQAAEDGPALKGAAACINSSKRPFVYFGGGLVASGAQEEVLALAGKIDAPLGCSMMGVSGIPSDTPRFLGMQGMHGHYASTVAMQSSDCIVACGVRFNDRCTGRLEGFAPGARIVHIDVDRAELGKNTPDTFGLQGDLKLTLQELLPLVRKTTHPEWRREVARLRKEELEQAVDDRPGFTPRNIMLALGRRLDPQTPVATDVGQHQMWAVQNLSFSRNRTLVSSGGLGAMGFGLGAAIGAYMGTGLRTVLVTGDGSFGMNLTELATAVTNRVPLVVLLLQNDVLGMVRQWQALFYDGHFSATSLDRRTDYVAVAQAFGARACRVTTLAELEGAFDDAFAAEGPYVIDCVIDADELVLPMLPPGGAMDQLIVKNGPAGDEGAGDEGAGDEGLPDEGNDSEAE